MTPLIGRLYRYRDLKTAGFYMVMSKTQDKVVLSPIFWRAEVITITVPRQRFEDGEFVRIKECPLNTDHVGVQAKYDREVHKRWKLINA